MNPGTKSAAVVACVFVVACSSANGDPIGGGGGTGSGAAGEGGAGGVGGSAGQAGGSGRGGAGGVGGAAGEGGTGGQPSSSGAFMLFHDDDAVYKATPGETDPPLELSTLPAPDTKVTSLIPSPDGHWVVYSVFGVTWGTALFVVPTDVEEDPVPITRGPTPGLGPTGGTLGGPKWNQASTLVAFEADYDVDRIYELYTSARDGSLIDQKVNGPLTPGEDVEDWYGWNRAGSLLLYLASELDEGSRGLYTAAPDGTDHHNVTSAAGLSRPFVTWSPDGSRVAYMAYPGTTGLYTQKPDGSDLQQVNGVPAPSGEVLGYAWNRDGDWISYWIDSATDGKNELYIAHPDGSENKKVSREIELDGLLLSDSNTWNPQGTRVGYLNRVHQTSPWELFTNNVDATDNQRVHSELDADGFVAPGYQWSPDGSRIAYMAGHTNQWANIYTAAPDGSNRQILAAVSFPGDPLASVFRWSPDTELLAYFSEEGDETSVAIRTRLPGDSNSSLISLPLEPGETLQSGFVWSPDSAWIAYLTASEGGFAQTLYVASADGTARRKVQGGLNFRFDILSHNFAWVLIDD